MAFNADIIREIRAVAEVHRIDPAALLAIAEVESGGRAFTRIRGQEMPLILFEYHVFHRALPATKRNEAVRRNLARKRWGALPYRRTQAARYAQLARASEIDREAAHAACSWGVGQVLGENAVWLGYPSPTALAREAQSGIDGQIRIMLAFIRKAGLWDELERRDWRGFARRYNGPGQIDFYAGRMAQAYKRHGGSSVPAVRDPEFLRIGDRGEDVAELQRNLRRLGYPLEIDGDFGPATRRAVTAFQTDQDLQPDGIAGPLTKGRIEALLGRDICECV